MRQYIPPYLLCAPYGNMSPKRGITYGQLFAWRKEYYNSGLREFTLRELQDLPDLPTDYDEDNLVEQYEDDIDDLIMLNAIVKTNKNLSLILFDSNVLLKVKACDLMREFKKKNSNTTPIIIINDISMSEHKNKLLNKKFKNFSKLAKFNDKFLRITNNTRHIKWYVKSELTHKIATDVEIEFFRNNNIWDSSKSRQEINDDIQIELMSLLASKYGATSIIVTDDKGMQRKLKYYENIVGLTIDDLMH